MRLLVVGAGGQVGDKVSRRAITQGHTVYGTYRTRRPTAPLAEVIQLDKTKPLEVMASIDKFKPDWVVDTSALHNVDYCETHPDEAMAVNSEGTKSLATACSRHNARLVFISTDFVFDGKAAPYTEESRPNPLSIYAKSKLEGEANALSTNPGNTCVVRPAVIYSWVTPDAKAQSSSGKPLNFAAWLVSQLAAGKEVSIVQDQVTSPTLADDLSGAILALLSKSESGLFHAAGTTPMSRYEFSVKVAEKMGYQEALIRPIYSSALKQVAKRPMNSSLISDKLKRDVGYSMKEVNASLDAFKAQSKGNPQI